MIEQTTLPWNTVGGYDFYEVVSVLQKSIRRGLEEDALFWAAELYLSGRQEHAWRRLRIIASEDVGLAAPSMVTDIQALYSAWKTNAEGENRLFFVQAVILLARSPKSRIVDNALMVYFEGPRPLREIPDYAILIENVRCLGRWLTPWVDICSDRGPKAESCLSRKTKLFGNGE